MKWMNVRGMTSSLRYGWHNLSRSAIFFPMYEHIPYEFLYNFDLFGLPVDITTILFSPSVRILRFIVIQWRNRDNIRKSSRIVWLASFWKLFPTAIDTHSNLCIQNNFLNLASSLCIRNHDYCTSTWVQLATMFSYHSDLSKMDSVTISPIS